MNGGNENEQNDATILRLKHDVLYEVKESCMGSGKSGGKGMRSPR